MAVLRVHVQGTVEGLAGVVPFPVLQCQFTALEQAGDADAAFDGHSTGNLDCPFHLNSAFDLLDLGAGPFGGIFCTAGITFKNPAGFANQLAAADFAL